MSDIKITVYMDGMVKNIDRDLLPKDNIGRPYDYIINEKDEFGIYKRDEKHYSKKDIEDQKEEIEKWYKQQVAEINKDYDDLEIELFHTLEEEARLYKSCAKFTYNKNGYNIAPTPYIDYILCTDHRYRRTEKDNLIDIIINKADIRKNKILTLVVEKKNRMNALTIV